MREVCSRGFSSFDQDFKGKVHPPAKKRMKGLLSVASIAPVIIAVSISASAQEPNQSKGQGYFFCAAGVTHGEPFGTAATGGTVHFGGGVEGFVYKRLGVGVEIGVLGPWSEFNRVIGVASANLSYHFLPSPAERQLEPFVTGGYTLFFRSGTGNGVNVGAGVNMWLNRKVAIRFEVRDNASGSFNSAIHLLGFRIGVTSR